MGRVPYRILNSPSGRLSYGYAPPLVDVPLGSNPAVAHQAMAAALDACLDDIAATQYRAGQEGDLTLPRGPMIVLRSPKGWTGPAMVDGQMVEGTFRGVQNARIRHCQSLGSCERQRPRT